MTIDLSGLLKLRAEVDAARKKMRDDAKALVKDGSKAIFEEYGDIVHSFGWTQYTPYFNDGEPCEFGVGELFIYAQDDVEEAKRAYGEDWESEVRYNEDWFYGGSWSFSAYDERSKVSRPASTYGNNPAKKGEDRYDEALQACQAIFGVFEVDEDMAKDIFGDHVTVKFTADGVTTEEYDHE